MAQHVKNKKDTRIDRKSYPKTLIVHLTEEMNADLQLLSFHYRTTSISNAIRNLFEDKINEIKESNRKALEEQQGVVKEG